MSRAIPQPPGYPFLGNIFSLNNDVPAHGFHELARRFGEIYQLNLLGRKVIFVSSYALVNELCDDSRFRKSVGGALKETRNLLHDGIFTAFDGEISWNVAHRLLVPAFGALRVRDMLEDMKEICDKMLSKWNDMPIDLNIDPTDDLTRVALDTIALCSMSYRLESFQSDSQPPFVQTMVDFLQECNNRANRPKIVQMFLNATNGKYQRDIEQMRDTAKAILQDRKANPTDRKDMLNVMLRGRDPKTGAQMSDESIIDNLLTFLIAGHETTSGTMSFALYYLLKHPEVMKELQSEIDNVLGDQPVQLGDLTRMQYLNAVIRETIRLQPTAAIRAIYPLEDTVIGGGKYFVMKNEPIALQIWDLHRDISIWGLDAEEFKPERMLKENFELLPPNAWQPFGFGMRSCIGRAFAWQEMCLVLSSIVQRFDLALVDPSYELQTTQAITIKPKDFRILARQR
ncbi:cytochrome P450 [Lentinula boryana]|uniref:Cytochrome P450 n=1 Tax=Lentinula boryana TaxID=40481 RepID=A0ABQ8QLK3_9AGAR|nr:cytochrome P450 [Lentinula boryana]